jgi:three-Cys-motif partner protein
LQQSDLYEGREQTLVKHYILGKYLERFAHIIGSRWGTINYVDCFAGPWNVRSDQFEDSSFYIALRELRKARATHRAKGRNVSLRCFFLEKDTNAYQELKQFADGVADVAVQTKNAELESAAMISFGSLRLTVIKPSHSFLSILPDGAVLRCPKSRRS